MARAKKLVEEEVEVKKPTSSNSKNKDGFEAGKPVSQDSYFVHMSKIRNKK